MPFIKSTPGTKPTHGTEIYRSVDNGVELQVRDENNVRYLYLESDAIQSAMALDHPASLPVAYTRYMAGALLLIPKPRRVLVVGLGGGTLVRFIQHCAPQCEIDAVDARADVIHVAQEFFGIQASSTVRLWHDDGAEFIQQRLTDEARYDIVFMDAYDHRGMAAPARDANVYSACAALTKPRGLFVSNLWASSPVDLRYCRGLAQRYFPGTLIAVPVPERGNIVLYAQHNFTETSSTVLASRVKTIRSATRENLDDVAQHLHAHLHSIWRLFGFDKIRRKFQ